MPWSPQRQHSPQAGFAHTNRLTSHVPPDSKWFLTENEFCLQAESIDDLRGIYRWMRLTTEGFMYASWIKSLTLRKGIEDDAMAESDCDWDCGERWVPLEPASSLAKGLGRLMRADAVQVEEAMEVLTRACYCKESESLEYD